MLTKGGFMNEAMINDPIMFWQSVTVLVLLAVLTIRNIVVPSSKNN